MITNSKLTIYHKSGLDVATRFEKWVRYNVEKVWIFKTIGGNINEGINNSNNLEVRIPYGEIDISNISLGDIVICDEVNDDIDTQQDLNYEIFNVVSINDNYFGGSPHIHLSCK